MIDRKCIIICLTNERICAIILTTKTRKDCCVVKKSIIIDTETTGLQAGLDEILQLSIIDTEDNTLYDGYFKPENHTSWEEAGRVNGITPEMVANCPSFKSELSKINDIFQDCEEIIGYNTPFDIGFLEASGVTIPETVTFIDVMREFAPIYGEWSEKHQCYKWQKLTVCANYYGFDWKSMAAHNSLADCCATLFCYKQILKSQGKRLSE